MHTRRFMDSSTIYSYDTLVAGLILQSTHVDWWCFIGFTASQILASTAGQADIPEWGLGGRGDVGDRDDWVDSSFVG